MNPQPFFDDIPGIPNMGRFPHRQTTHLYLMPSGSKVVAMLQQHFMEEMPAHPEWNTVPTDVGLELKDVSPLSSDSELRRSVERCRGLTWVHMLQLFWKGDLTCSRAEKSICLVDTWTALRASWGKTVGDPYHF